MRLRLDMRWAAAALAVTALGAVLGAGGSAAAEDPVRIGAIYPLTGAYAGVGAHAKAAIEIAVDIVNHPHQGLEALPLGAGQGLARRGGLKVAAILADDQGNPSMAQSQAMRLVSHDQAAALIGAHDAAATLAASAAAERRGVPLLVPDATAPEITGGGRRWVFRTTTVEADFASADAHFLDAVKQAGQNVRTVAVFAEAGAGGAAPAAVRGALQEAGFEVAPDIEFAAGATDLSPQVSRLRDSKPDAVFFAGGPAEAALFVKTLKLLDYRPPLLIDAGTAFADPGFVAAVGNLAQGVLTRSAWNADAAADSPAAIVGSLYKAKTGRALDDAVARIVQGFLVLADAIDRAGSADPAALRTALRETDLKPDQLIVGYRGVRFDDTGQNTLASSYLVQLRGKQFVPVWPDQGAAAKLELPYRGWQ